MIASKFFAGKQESIEVVPAAFVGGILEAALELVGVFAQVVQHSSRAGLAFGPERHGEPAGPIGHPPEVFRKGFRPPARVFAVPVIPPAGVVRPFHAHCLSRSLP